MNTSFLQSALQRSLIKADIKIFLSCNLGVFFHFSHCISVAIVYLAKRDNDTGRSGGKMTTLAICELHRKERSWPGLKNLYHLKV